eukprot:TRINITY_DN33832_c0_g1_i2.p2 TRINITY_DN33832_c0_g1~~TRINITY_DN33832_c0_g1_i2.p2  ORF type:complete len:114 (+),score=5.64 TRINITY_DN33832_c0_g1_i2:132-473(+)
MCIRDRYQRRVHGRAQQIVVLAVSFMRCVKCACQEDKVIDSRSSREGMAIRRRRECLACGHRFTTYEEIEQPSGLMVRKRDGKQKKKKKKKKKKPAQKPHTQKHLRPQTERRS